MNEKNRNSDQQQDAFDVCLFGAPLDVGNMGCRALAVSLIRLILDARPNSRIQLLYDTVMPERKEVRLDKDRVVGVEVVNCRLSPKSRLNEHLIWILLLSILWRIVPIRSLRARIRRSTPWLDRLSKAHFVGDIRGGDSFSDIYGFPRFLFGSLPNLTAFLLGKPLVLLPQTYGPFRSRLTRCLAKFIFRRSTKIFAREKQSLEFVREFLGNREVPDHIQLCPDVAFSLAAIPPEQVSIISPLERNREETIIGLNISGLLFMGGYTRSNMFGLRCDYKELVDELIDRLLSERNVQIVLVPHTFGTSAENDQSSCRAVWESFQERGIDRVHLLDGNYDQNEVKQVIGQFDFFIGSRMHACIAAISQGVPTVGVAYSGKFLGVFDTAGVGGMVLDARTLSLEDLIEGCMERYRNRADTGEGLTSTVLQVSCRPRAVFKELMASEAD